MTDEGRRAPEIFYHLDFFIPEGGDLSCFYCRTFS